MTSMKTARRPSRKLPKVRKAHPEVAAEALPSHRDPSYDQRTMDTIALNGLLKSANLLRDAIEALSAGKVETAFMHGFLSDPYDSYEKIRDTLREKFDELWKLIGPFMMDTECRVMPHEPA